MHRALLVFWWVTILGGWVTILGLVANGVWKGVYPWVFRHSKQLSLNKFFDPSIPSLLVVASHGCFMVTKCWLLIGREEKDGS